MTIVDLLLYLLVAGVCGSIGQAIGGYTLGGCLVSIAVGFIGAITGIWISAELGLPEIFLLEVGGKSFPVIWSIIGSALFVAVIGLLTRKK